MGKVSLIPNRESTLELSGSRSTTPQTFDSVSLPFKHVIAESPQFLRFLVWRTFCDWLSPMRTRLPWEFVVGRWMAFCAHPVCAWRVPSKALRALLVTSYFAAGYTGMLVALLALE